MSNHTILIMHHDGIPDDEEGLLALGQELNRVACAGANHSRSDVINIQGREAITPVISYHSSESAMVIARGMIAEHKSRTTTRSDRDSSVSLVDTLNRLLLPLSLVVHKASGR